MISARLYSQVGDSLKEGNSPSKSLILLDRFETQLRIEGQYG